MNTQLADDLQHFGVPRQKLLWLDEPRAQTIDYLDLIKGMSLSRRGHRTVAVEAVVETEQQPLLYIVRHASLTTAGQSDQAVIHRLRFLLSSRGSGGYLALHAPGKLTMYPIAGSSDSAQPMVRSVHDVDASALLAELSVTATDTEPGYSRQAKADNRALHELLFGLLATASNQLLDLAELRDRPDDALSMIGRALFMRFIIDRGLWQMDGETRPEACFSTPALAARTCQWLDDTFNGELLPLFDGKYEKSFSELGSGSAAFRILSNIMDHALDGQLPLKLWREIDFAYVPIGLLSEVYERFAHRHAGKSAVAESIHYTPRHIASLMVDQAFGGLEDSKREDAKCLDPAVGGGIFLVLCFRRLVKERWERHGRPTRQELRELIYSNLAGFDINISALRLTALGLYLAALELDPDPGHAGNLQFNPLQGTVLIHTRGESEPHPNEFVLGSLGSKIGPEHQGRYNIVIGNPPWTAWKKGAVAGEGMGKGAKLNREASALARRVAAGRVALTSDAACQARLKVISETYENPDHNPDMPFVWRSMEWAVKDTGVVALAVHGRLLFKQTKPALRAREALFSSLRITGILNGAALRKSPVWAGITPHWCLLFAVNQVPADSNVFYFVSPELDDQLNRKSRMRIDFGKARPVEFKMLRDQPTLLKTLFRGTDIDAQVLATVKRSKGIPLGRYWRDELKLQTGEGFQTVLEDKDGNLRGPEELSDASHLFEVPMLDKSTPAGHRIDYASLPLFKHKKIMFPRREAIYLAPVLIVPEALDPNRTRGGALVSERKIAYSESFYGWSAAERASQAVELVRYLHVLTYSSLFYHFALMTSSKFGVERDTLLKEDVDAFPVIPFDELAPSDVKKATALSLKIEGGSADFDVVDRWVAGLYGIDAAGMDAMRDAMAVAMPYPASQRRGQMTVTPDEVAVFSAQLQESLSDLFAFIGFPITTHVAQVGRAWSFLEIAANGKKHKHEHIEWMQSVADADGASVIYVPAEDGRLVVGMLSQYRYWTPSRARLLARDIIEAHSDILLASQESVA